MLSFLINLGLLVVSLSVFYVGLLFVFRRARRFVCERSLECGANELGGEKRPSLEKVQAALSTEKTERVRGIIMECVVIAAILLLICVTLLVTIQSTLKYLVVVGGVTIFLIFASYETIVATKTDAKIGIPRGKDEEGRLVFEGVHCEHFAEGLSNYHGTGSLIAGKTTMVLHFISFLDFEVIG